MAKEPQTANEYEDRVTAAVNSVLVELGQRLGSYREKFVLIGGAVPPLMIPNADMKHVGTVDIDLALDARALQGGEYKTLVDTLLANDYKQTEGTKKFQLERVIAAEDGGAPIKVIVDFLAPKSQRVKRNRPPLMDNFVTIPADGADLALRDKVAKVIKGKMPNGADNEVTIYVASIPTFLVMKGYAIFDREKPKDAYDIYYCVRNYPGGVTALADACRYLKNVESAQQGFAGIAAKFREPTGLGPIMVRNFVRDSSILGGRTPEQWQQDAFGQVDAFIRALRGEKPAA